jgi:CRISPR-associated endonuclease/helicase Cas3
MTATQPLIFDQNQIEELAKTFPQAYQKSRVNLQIKTDSGIPIDKFREEVNGLIDAAPSRSFLLVMNTIRSATYIYHSLNTSRENYYLSASLVPKQRRERLDRITEALDKREPIVLVSTQVVEAGIDLDFDAAIRDIGPIDSIVQVSGRCNRHALRDPTQSPVYVYDVIDDEGLEFGKQIYGSYLIEKTKEVLTESRIKLDPLQLSSAYYQKVRMGASELESAKLLESMHRLDYQGLANFKLIDDQDSVSIFVEIDKEAEDIWQRYEAILNRSEGLQAKEEFLQIRQSFYDYIVNVREKDVHKLDRARGFYRIPHSGIHEFYDAETGFRR